MFKSALFRLSLLVAVILVLVLPISSQRVEGQTVSDNGSLLAFISERDGNAEIYVWDGTSLTNISQTKGNDSQPRWSADGRLAFLSTLNDHSEIYVWDRETLTNVDAAQTVVVSGNPVWNADGRLAFISDRDGIGEVSVWDGQSLTNFLTDGIDVDGFFWSEDGVFSLNSGTNDEQRHLTDGQTITNVTPPNARYAGHTSFSADGRLAFEAYVNDNWDIYVWDGATLINISNNPNFDQQAEWSTDGRLAFLSADFDGNAEIFVWDGESLTSIAQNMARDFPPTWSANGQLVLGSYSDGNGDIYVWDGESLTNVSQNEAYNNHPTWSADGRLAFIANHDGGIADIYVWDGESLTTVLADGTNLYTLQWSADGRLAFTSSDLDYSNEEVYVWDGETLTNVSQGEGYDYDPIWWTP